MFRGKIIEGSEQKVREIGREIEKERKCKVKAKRCVKK